MRIGMANSTDAAEVPAFLRGCGPVGALIAAHDWSATSLGPISAWPQSWKTATAMILRAQTPMMIMWGADGVMIYNQAYSAFIGDMHPEALGAKAREAWRSAADMIGEMLQLVLSGGCLTLHDRTFTLMRSGRSEPIWLDVASSPIPDESGQPAGALVRLTETTQRVLAERKAGVETERRSRMFAQGPGFLLLLSGPELKVEFSNEAFDRLFGVENSEGKTYREVFSAYAERGYDKLLERVYRTGERYAERAARICVPRRDGTEVEHFIDCVIQPVTDGAGAISGLFVEGFDVTEQVRAQHAAKESERRFTAATAIARLGVFEWDSQRKALALDDRAREIYGFEPGEPLRLAAFTRRIDPEDLERVLSLGATNETRRHAEYRIRLPDGTSRTVATLADITRGPDGTPLRIIGVVADATESRRAEHHQRLLINELNHRVKNTLATVQSIAAQTLRSAPDTASARAAFEARLMALAATHDVLTAESWHGARIADVVSSAMAPFESTRRPQILRSGPPVWVSAPRALALSMALHELATNAVKYGALSQPEGQVRIRWRRTRANELVLEWVEQGGPQVEPPTRSGFGTRLLERSLARELDGAVEFRFAPEGVSCEIRFPIAEAPPQATLADLAL